MGGAHVAGSADKKGILGLLAYQARNDTSAIAAGFPFSTDGYASFLVAYEQGRSFMWSYVLDVKTLWIEEFEHKLGAPQGVATLDKEGAVYTRNFAHATITFDTTSNKGAFQWKS